MMFTQWQEPMALCEPVCECGDILVLRTITYYPDGSESIEYDLVRTADYQQTWESICRQMKRINTDD